MGLDFVNRLVHAGNGGCCDVTERGFILFSSKEMYVSRSKKGEFLARLSTKERKKEEKLPG